CLPYRGFDSYLGRARQRRSSIHGPAPNAQVQDVPRLEDGSRERMKSSDRDVTSGLPQIAPKRGASNLMSGVKKAGSLLWQTHPTYIGTAVAQLAILVFGVASGVVSARLLGPQGRGELAAITLWPMAFVFFTSLGLNQAIVFHTGKQRHP